MRSKVLSMTVLLMAHDHLLRVSIRRRAHSAPRTEYRVSRMDKTCKRCAALSARLIESTRAFRAEVAKLLAASR